ncbi:MAG TPA: carbamate kinase [Candidatus Dorea intestinavium]|nr:carbamate kinase [Candidatus Dorea intestinavium]
MKKRVVVALGHKALGTTLPEQKEAVKRSAKAIVDLVEKGYQVGITHSNAPQVGMIHAAMNEFGVNHEEYTQAPMSICSAMSQGYIGYDLQNAIREELLNRGIYRNVSTIITQVVVDPYDEAFYAPSKVLGRYMSEEEAEKEKEKGNFVVEEKTGYRRIVSAPSPVKIVELDTINALLDQNQLVIACGGGGIPVLVQDNHLKGASAVIEKDLTAGMMADGIEAEALIFLTGVDQVSLYKDTPKEEKIAELTVAEAKKYMEEGHFGTHNMLPKFVAATSFVEKDEERKVLITSMENLCDALDGKSGTWIKK